MLRTKSDVKIVKNTKELEVHEYFVKNDSENLGFSVAYLDGEYGDNKNHAVDQIIFIIEGTLSITINNNKYNIKEDDSIFIKKGTWYYVKGKAKFAVITNPAWYYEQYETKDN